MIKNNVKKLYAKLYPNMTINQIQKSIDAFDKHSLEQGISLESSNRHKYLRGWLMMDNFKRSKGAEIFYIETAKDALAAINGEGA